VIVYKAESKCGHVYVGATSRSLAIRIIEHKCHAIKTNKQGKFYDLIRKIGIESFRFTILTKCSSVDEMHEKEKYFIEKFDSHLSGLNGSLGGRENRKLIISKKFLAAARKQGLARVKDGTMKKMWAASHTSENQKKKARIHHEKNHLRMLWYEARCSESGKVIARYRGYKDAAKEFGCSGSALRSYVLRGKHKNITFNFITVPHGK